MDESSRKGLAGTATTVRTPPAPGTRAFAVVKAATALNTALYRLSRGRIGGKMGKAPVLLVHHKGRRSGEERVAPLIYLDDGGSFVIVASYGGAPKNPAWFHNLMANPDTRVELRGRTIAVRAQRVDDESERSRLWAELVRIWPSYDDYQANTERKIPLVRLVPAA